jgi:hypothetical protein
MGGYLPQLRLIRMLRGEVVARPAKNSMGVVRAPLVF